MKNKGKSEATALSANKKKGKPPAAQPPPYNSELDPDNATSPLSIEEREREGRRKFYPEGPAVDPPEKKSEK